MRPVLYQIQYAITYIIYYVRDPSVVDSPENRKPCKAGIVRIKSVNRSLQGLYKRLVRNKKSLL